MEILRFPLGQMQANCYFLINGKECLLIDPADSADFILEEIQRRNLHLVGMMATHGHFDHVMAAGEIQMSFENMPLYIHHDDLFLLKRLKETAKYFLGFDPQIMPIKNTSSLKKGQFSLGDFNCEILSTPGHTPGSCCFYFREEATVFTGDTIFKDGIGRYDFSYSHKRRLFHSIESILTLPDFTTMYSGHGDDTLIQFVKQNHKE